jgi:hypothetical protein
MEIPKHTVDGVGQGQLSKMAEQMPQRGRVMAKLSNPFIPDTNGGIRSDGVVYSIASIEAYLKLSKDEADDIHKRAFNEVKADTSQGQRIDDNKIFRRELELASLMQYRKSLS